MLTANLKLLKKKENKNTKKRVTNKFIEKNEKKNAIGRQTPIWTSQAKPSEFSLLTFKVMGVDDDGKWCS